MAFTRSVSYDVSGNRWQKHRAFARKATNTDWGVGIFGSDMYESMTLAQIGEAYRGSADILRQRIRELRRAMRGTADPEELWALKQRIAALSPMLRDCRRMAEICERYYERGYHPDERYVF